MRSSTTNSLRLEHREPTPYGVIPKFLHYGRWIPRPKITWVAYAMLAAMAYPFVWFVAESDYFAVKNWNITGAERLSVTEVRWALGITENAQPNIFAFHKGEAVEMLAEHPAIQTAAVVKQFPDTIELVVYERIPVALVVTSEGLFVTDRAARLFANANVTDLKDTSLPVVNISGSGPLKLGDTLPEEALEAALLYNGTFKKMGHQLLFETSEYSYQAGVGLTLVLRQGTRLMCGLLPPSQTIPKYETLLQSLPPKEMVDYADLRIDNHIPYKLGNPRANVQLGAD